MTDKNEQLNTLVHDARKPLNHISMHAEIIKILSEDAAKNSEISDAANKIIAASKACSELLQQIAENAKWI